jgi:hypothetical protein
MTMSPAMKEAADTTAWPTARNFLQRVQWVVIPILVFATAEAVFRNRFQAGDMGLLLFTGRAEQVARDGALDFLFLGTSRVYAAIDTKSFEETMTIEHGHPVRAANLGTGSSTPREWLLGLRSLVRAHPGSLRGCVVFIEAPGGVVAPQPPEEEVWVFEDHAVRISALLEHDDFKPLWLSGTPFATKLGLSSRILGRRSVMVVHREIVRLEIFWKIRTTAAQLMNRLLPAATNKTVATPDADLASGGGIRVNPAEIKAIRKLAVEYANKDLQNAKLASWDQNVFLNILHLIRQEGGQPIFFVMPLHPIQLINTQTKIQQANRRIFLEKMASLGIPVLSPDFSTMPEDFPDIWHMARSRSKAFTVAVARAWNAYRAQVGRAAPGSAREP